MSKLLFEKLLSDFKKSNKERKEKIASKAGYDVEGYLKYLENQIALWESASSEKGISADIPTSPPPSLCDMVIAFDTTGSMSSYIGAVKKHVKELIPNLLRQNPNLQISVVAFGDYCDMTNSVTFGAAYQVINLTSDENALINFISKAKDTSGGDSDEFYELVIKKIVEETSWRLGSSKSVLFIADAEPHGIGYTFTSIIKNNQIDWKKEAEKAASLDIQFDTLSIKPDMRWLEELSKITNGVNLPFSSASKMSNLVEASVLARGGEETKAAFYSRMESSDIKNDSELTKTYSMYKTIVER